MKGAYKNILKTPATKMKSSITWGLVQHPAGLVLSRPPANNPLVPACPLAWVSLALLQLADMLLRFPSLLAYLRECSCPYKPSNLLRLEESVLLEVVPLCCTESLGPSLLWRPSSVELLERDANKQYCGSGILKIIVWFVDLCLVFEKYIFV